MAKQKVRASTKFIRRPNRYEQHYLRQQSDVIRVIEASGVKEGVGVLSDFFHMHIEETDTPQAFRDAKGYTTHIHLADNTRMEPGMGDIDFVASFKVLRENGFDGYMAYECGITGNTIDRRTSPITKTFLRSSFIICNLRLWGLSRTECRAQPLFIYLLDPAGVVYSIQAVQSSNAVRVSRVHPAPFA
jgi:hypothetical protein